MLNRPNPDRDYRILVKYTRRNPRWHKIYEGPWNADAAYRYDQTPASVKRIQPVLTAAEVASVLDESPSLALLDGWLDELYPLEAS
ncbi:hypothetical protein [Amycolatopsis lexingtonensis]|uniref:hypothetical protein n=1 Tax=Amycolatopsis lexingtonensis TaxID=218822 RepID=UPI003F700BF7